MIDVRDQGVKAMAERRKRDHGRILPSCDTSVFTLVIGRSSTRQSVLAGPGIEVGAEAVGSDLSGAP